MAAKFAVSHKIWLDTESTRITDIILGIKFWGRVWTDKTLTEELNAIGLPYTLEQVQEINDELHTQGIVADVVTPLPVPAPAPIAET